jgi:hypothetical protein
MDQLTGRVNEMESAHFQIAGQMGHEFGERAPALVEGSEYPQASREVSVSAREQLEESQTVALQLLCHLWRKSEAILGLSMVHKGFASWKSFIMRSVIEDKRAYTCEGRVTSLYTYAGGASTEALKEKFSAWSDHEDECARVDYRCLSNVSVDYSRLLWGDSLEVEYEANEFGSDPCKFRSAGMVTPRVGGKGQSAARETLETIRKAEAKAEAQLNKKKQKSKRDRRSSTSDFPPYEAGSPRAGYGSNEEEGRAASDNEGFSNGEEAVNVSESSSDEVHGGSRNMNAAQSMFDTSADVDGDRGSDNEEDEGSDSHEEVNDEDLLEAKKLLLSWKHPVHDVGSADIKRLSDYATKFLTALKPP